MPAYFDLKPGSLVLLPDSGRELLRRELAFALEELGFRVRRVMPDRLLDSASPDFLLRVLDEGPALFFSVNLQGLLPGGRVPETLRQAGVPVLAWFVDNPWHVLSGMRDPSWKRWQLAVTDDSFVVPLRSAGAGGVLHLPLAACPRSLFADKRPATGEEAIRGLFFAGRASFPGRDTFFAGQSVPPELLEEAGAMSRRGERADFHWWVRKLDLADEVPHFWPGKKARRPGLGAALSNRIWRAERLAAAAPLGVTLHGDADWGAELGQILVGQDGGQNDGQGIRLHPPFDYYARAHELYRRAEFSLNLNSLMLVGGLTQRIFDIWAAGGFCLTGNSPGLDLFPDELTGPVTFSRPEELPELMERFRAAPARKRELAEAWRGHILGEHTYVRRLQGLLCGKTNPGWTKPPE
ncbi:MAG: glycosyltransferase [Deltaproteobacteria bacterium]|jgi:hypothetical protein|nr:glycosyltransferase [Deltaproteobacteria bacterium]